MPRYSKRFLETKHPTLYTRRQKGGDVRLYSNPDASELFAIFPLGHPRRPRHGRRWITIDCFRWKLEWLQDAESVTRSAPSPSNPEPKNTDSKR